MSLPRKLLAVCVILIGGAALLYELALPGLSSARPEPPQAEVAVATWLLHHSVPDAAKAERDPLGADPADIAAGHDLFQKNCEICHGYDGNGTTQIGSTEFPRAPVLKTLLPSLTDGEIFYHVRNGIRNTGMPAWSFPDRQMWQLVRFMRNLPTTAPIPAALPAGHPDMGDRHYVGSESCKSCHAEIYARWQKTPMANVVRDPHQHPDAIIPDFSKPDPLLTFSKDDVSFVYGSVWKQRYFKKVGDDYFPLPAQWDVTHKIWRPYFVENGGDWWSTLFPPDNFQRPTGQLCDGCHSVNYDIATKQVTEWNVGCEACHGPASEHVKNPIRATVINPARLDYVKANDTCIQCHSQGRPLGDNKVDGKYYDWPVGFHMGANLSDYWQLEPHTLGKLSFTHFPDGTAHKNRMQGNDFSQSLMYTRGVTCFSCHDVHGTDNPAELRAPVAEICMECHAPNGQNGPRAASIEEHTHHKPGSPGSECVACHMPKIEQTVADVNVHAHTFRFITPAETEAYKIPNPCTNCHKDKSNEWANNALKSWTNRSPWRMND
ncbi:MAG TPA: cytochrome c3 family protein [Aliidongia sp.]|nr:cytochrome c3 family protein [Aliidongia sp.]